MQKGTFEAREYVVPPHIMQGSGNDEISVASLLFIVRRRWLYLLAGVVMGVLIATVYVTFAAPTYESRAVLQIGKVDEAGLIEDVDALIVRLIEQYGRESHARRLANNAYLKQVTRVSGPNNVVRLVGVGSSPENTRDFVADIVAELIKYHEKIYAASVDPLQQRLAVIDARKTNLTKQLTELRRLIDRLRESQPLQASVLTIQETQLYFELNQLERDRLILQRHITRPYSSPSTVMAEASLSAPVVMRKLTTVGIIVMLGLGLGLLVVFFVEVFARLRAATKTNARAM